MRVELLYTPGCSSYKKALSTLETVIAEERLPLHIETIETSRPVLANSTIRIDGLEVGELLVEPQGDFCRLYKTNTGLSNTPEVESLRALIWKKWKDITESSLLKM